jgi:site-specific DNA-methyltransferase (adenine-specific)
MGKSWDSTGIAYNVQMWKDCLRVLKPGGHLLAFSGSRTYHRMAVAIEDAGFQIRDQMMWVYGSGFPKSHNVSKALDKMAGAEREIIGEKSAGIGTGKSYGKIVGEREKVKSNVVPITAPSTEAAQQWEGWGTALKPAHEPIVLARKPFEGSVADNILKWGVGGLNISGCRVGDEVLKSSKGEAESNGKYGDRVWDVPERTGRFPANFMHDGSQEVLDLFPNDAGRFFYCPKANKKDRDEGCEDFDERRESDRPSDDKVGGDNPRNRSNTPRKNSHPTVKPTELMRYLCRLITPPNGTVLDPFNGSGSTGKASVLEGFNYTGIELDEDYIKISKARIESIL